MTDHDTRTRTVVDWLREDAHEDAESVLLAALNDVDHTRQRRAWGPAWRFTDMNGYAKLLVATAAVVVVAALGFTLLPQMTGPGGAQPSLSPAPTPTPLDLPSAGEISAGTYRLGDAPVLLTVPSGWEAADGMEIRKHRDQPGEVMLTFFGPDIAVYPDACANDVTPPVIGPTVDDLLTALAAQAQSDVSDPVAATVGDITATRVDVSVPSGLDLATCFEGILRVWTTPRTGYLAWGTEPSGTYAPAVVHMADTPSGRVVFVAGQATGATDADIAELDAIVASMVIEE